MIEQFRIKFLVTDLSQVDLSYATGLKSFPGFGTCNRRITQAGLARGGYQKLGDEVCNFGWQFERDL